MDLKERPKSATRRHPWELARFRFFRGVLTGAGGLSRPSRVLDVGSGDAWLASSLLADMPEGSRVTCWDAGYAPDVIAEVGRAMPASLELVRERPSARYETVTLLDVLEHVEDDLGFLSAIVRENVEPGGTVLVSVPAWQALYAEHDRLLSHYRRYSPARASAVLERAGLTIEQRGGLFHSLLPVRVATKLRESIFGAPVGQELSLAWEHGALVTGAIDAWLRMDTALSRVLARGGLEAPGLSFWALCRKA